MTSGRVIVESQKTLSSLFKGQSKNLNMEDPLANAVVSPVSPVADDFSGTEGVYLLPHHQEEIERLQRQHEFIKASNDGALTNVNLPDGAKVLDSGCADGEC